VAVEQKFMDRVVQPVQDWRGRQIAQGLDRQPGVERLGHDGGGGRTLQQGVAVGGRVLEGLRSEQAVGARAVVDDEGLAQRLAQGFVQLPREHVDHAARAAGHDDLDGAGRPRRVALGAGGAAQHGSGAAQHELPACE
jgi:hypothetical protein